MDQILRKYAVTTVPRYTSYPTVPHFQKDFPAETLEAWLNALDAERPVSLYVHIPFCRHLCWYCGCNMKLAKQYAPVTHYVDALLDEIDLVASKLPGRLTVSHLHFGGGTPTTLMPEDLDRVMSALHDRFNICEGAELAIEGDPRTVTRDAAARIAALGFTRASFGIQEFNEKVQQSINRIQPVEMVRQAVEDLRGEGIHAINFDLIYGLPHQTVTTLMETVKSCVTMQPDRFALFGYAHVPWMAKKQRLIDESALPGIEARFEQAEAAAKLLADSGYERVGLDHFALPEDPLAQAACTGRLHRNFQGYTTDRAETLIGLGSTSIGSTPYGYVQNISETGAWMRAIAEGRLPVAKGHCLTQDDRLRGHVIERLMCDGRADTVGVASTFGALPGWDLQARSELRDMARDGLVQLTEECVLVTEKGRPFLRTVAAAFDTYRQRTQVRHSLAV